jgi:GWxTD domain-containing protein
MTEYHQLKAAEERDNFMIRFWSRRDSIPGTLQNEFRDEFYRRVDYANAHFADPKDPARSGMETDRGRIYVIFGAPAQVDVFQAGAYEIWHYAAA